jgi:NADPH:quinone reductase-like Zn-dependent oxidoreductase
MRAMVIDEAFGLENLRFVERDVPALGAGQLLLRIKAVSLNYRDLLMVTGNYNPTQPLPLVPCSDAAGEVVDVGEGVSSVTVGDRVMPVFSQSWLAGEPTRERLRATLGGPLDGTLREYMVVPEYGVVAVPDHLSDLEAATLPCAALTAWTALAVEGQIKPGATVLVQGSGGVSVFALQFAKLFGARVFVISSNDRKLERLRELGADGALNYRKQPNWGPVVKRWSGGEGVDYVVEVGGARTLQQSLLAVRMGGQIGLIGVLSGRTAPLDIAQILMRYVRVQGILVGHRDSFIEMTRAIAAAEMHPLLDRSFPFTEAPQAMRYLEQGGHLGKVTIAS